MPENANSQTSQAEETKVEETDVTSTPDGRHVRYYFEDEMSIFSVEGILFKVHRHFLARDSDVLGDMFKLPSGESEGVEGREDASPIVFLE
ncbi:unnamed protein product [Somion occarium]|uniref:BTB domain-containing protein n=1 Tax=Somion occarium TaxID=3059160 RepID=A0ABP1DSU1_9APHY